MLLWVTGGLMLLAGGLLTYLLKLRRGSEAPYRVRLHRNLRVLRQMRRLLRSKHSQDPHALQVTLPLLVDAVYQLNRRIASLPPLPAAPEGEPRLLDAAREAADNPEVSGQALLDVIKDEGLSTTEIIVFPVCVAYAESQRLGSVLSSMLSDMRQARHAVRLARRMQRSKHPEQLLRKDSLNSFGLNTLRQALEDGHADTLLNLLTDWLSELDLTPADLSSSAELRKQRHAEEIRRAQDCFSALQRLNWRGICSAADASHSLLLGDPGNVYPRMDAASQLQLRLDVDALSRHTALPATELIRRAFILCGAASESSLESCVSYYFQDAQGCTALHRSLPTRHGQLYARSKGRDEVLRYIAAWSVAVVTGLGFLQSGQPVLMLPFFLVLTGCLLRSPAWKLPRHLPGMQLPHGDQSLRTLVVLHAYMAEPEDAVAAVQRLQQTIRSLHGEQADFLLIGDFGPCITAVSGFDQPIMQSASAAVAALGDDRVMYLHRGRAWDDAAHCYRARAGQRGAITEVCHLIATGESQDALPYATVLPASLERRYGYVLTLGADAKPSPGMLTRFLSVMAHPLCQPHPTPKGMHGHAMLLPEGDAFFEGTGFIRPDAFLEAVDGRLHDPHPASALCGELAGQAPVDGAQVFRPHPPHSWDDQYFTTLHAWQLLPWQLPIVSTPSGWIDNPLTFFQRFHLRELLRPSLVPLSQAAMLLWGLLTGNMPLMLLALLLPEFGKPLRRREDVLKLLCRISLLPTKVAVDVAAIVQLLRRKSHLSPDWPSLEAWTQGLTATLMAALVFLLPAGAVAAFVLAVLFACFPLAHRFLDTQNGATA